jgi:predicted nucleotidyltransferase
MVTNRQRAADSHVSFRKIRNVADQIVRAISPQRIILFGSYARRCASKDSDVDLLVITDRPAGTDASLRLRSSIDYSFALDLIVCDARRLARRIKAGDFFLEDAVRQGRVLYEKAHR